MTIKITKGRTKESPRAKNKLLTKPAISVFENNYEN